MYEASLITLIALKYRQYPAIWRNLINEPPTIYKLRQNDLAGFGFVAYDAAPNLQPISLYLGHCHGFQTIRRFTLSTGYTTLCDVVVTNS
jgi:hypothetical protein